MQRKTRSVRAIQRILLLSGACLAVVLAPGNAALAWDADGDRVSDAFDNCVNVPNGFAETDQLDTDQDGYGNPCDGDLDQDGVVDDADASLMLAAFSATVDLAGNGADMDGDGDVDAMDWILFVGVYGAGVPGPSGLACAGTQPCLPAGMFSPDVDGDDVLDAYDNCLDVPNGASQSAQLDTDEDGYGNPCDGDFDQSGAVDASDFALLVDALNAGGDLLGNGTDMNGDGFVNTFDYDRFLVRFAAGANGPSGLACAGTAPCYADTEKILVGLFNFIDNPGNGMTHAEAVAVMEEVRRFYEENSYGRISFSGIENRRQAADVVGWIDTDLTAECGSANHKAGLLDALTAEGVDWAAYDQVMLVAPFVGCGALAHGVFGTFTPTFSLTSFAPVIVEHEMSHHFGGNPHGQFRKCVGGSFPKTEDPNTVSCVGELEEYSVTGVGFGHLAALEKRPRFLRRSQVLEVTESGTFTLKPLETVGGVKALKIGRCPDPAGPCTFPHNRHLYVEFRQDLGYDAFFSDIWGWTDYREGAMIRDVSILIDATPFPEASQETPTLPVGESLTDPLTGNTITVDALVPGVNGSLTVTVDIVTP